MPYPWWWCEKAPPSPPPATRSKDAAISMLLVTGVCCRGLVQLLLLVEEYVSIGVWARSPICGLFRLLMLPCETGRAGSISGVMAAGVMAADSGEWMEMCERGELLDEQKDDCGVKGGGGVAS